MNKQLLVAGGGIGGLSVAIACKRAGWDVRVYERAEQFTEVGAGVQLGPNVTRVLQSWGLGTGLELVAAFPRHLRVRSAVHGGELASMPLGADFSARYGAPYATIHRADLLGLLVAVARHEHVDLHLGAPITSVLPQDDAVRARVADRFDVEGDALVGADGLWSVVRRTVCGDGGPISSGHLAYRGVTVQRNLPERLRSQDVTVWLGPHLHMVVYPVHRGEELNVVVIVQGRPRGSPQNWNQDVATEELHKAMGRSAAVSELVQAIEFWRLWELNDREPIRTPDDMAKGRVALAGDSAHPMLPFFAQGSGMAIEDAAELGRMLAMVPEAGIEVPLALRRYALNRWQRCAQVQTRSRRNGDIFHASGLRQWGRDMSLRLLGSRLLDQPWLYGDGR